MIKPLVVCGFAVALAGALPPAVAGAEPAPSACTYTLSPPHVVSVGGTDMVRVTLGPAACDGATPTMSVACVQVQGGQGPGKCAQKTGTLIAQAFLSPFQPGATYIATGRGCASTGNPPNSVCQPTGPLTAVL